MQRKMHTINEQRIEFQVNWHNGNHTCKINK